MDTLILAARMSFVGTVGILFATYGLALPFSPVIFLVIMVVLFLPLEWLPW